MKEDICTCKVPSQESAICKVHGEPKVISTHACGAELCKDGKPHDWDGPVIETEFSSSTTCSRCGMDSMTWSMFNGP